MRKIELLGKRFPSKGCGDFIVEELVFEKGTEKYYKIKFVNTGGENICEARHIRNGSVTDVYHKNIFGVACRGNIHCTTKYQKIMFKRWYAMIERCYNPRSISYKSYGAKGCTVSDAWLCFETFYNDHFQISGYDKEALMSGNLQLDKDTLVSGNNTYGKEACCYILKRDNARYQVSKRKAFVACSPDGNETVYYNQNECARKNNLTARTIGKVLNGELKTHKGWKFKYVV